MLAKSIVARTLVEGFVWRCFP